MVDACSGQMDDAITKRELGFDGFPSGNWILRLLTKHELDLEMIFHTRTAL